MDMQERRISSGYTFFYKMVFTPLWSFMFGVGTWALWFGKMTGPHNEAPPEEMKYVFLCVWIIGTVSIMKLCGGLKRVRVKDGRIYISNYMREIAVPPTAIKSVSENRWINTHPVTISFRNMTAFGDKVTFIPTWRFLQWRRHPVVDELRQMAGLKAE